MNFKKLSLVTAVGAALVGCGADDQAYEYVDRDVYEYALSSLTAGTPRKVSDENCVDCYEIPVDGLWLFQQSMGDLSRTSQNTPYAYDYINGERLVKLKFTQDGLVAELVEGDITFDGETTRFPQEHNEPRLFTITGTYEGYQCKEDSYGDCTNAEEKISDPNVRWWQKTHFTPDFVSLDMHDEQYFFEKWLGDKQSKSLTHLEFDPKNAGVINIEHEHNIVSKAGNPEKADVFYSLVRLDKLATPGYQAVHYDLEEHSKFGLFKTSYEKLDGNYIPNQNGHEGYFINRFDPRKDRIEYQLSDEFFRKDANGNLVNKAWLDATIKGFDYINNSLKDNFSANGRLVPELVITNQNEAVGAKVGDIRTNVIHIVPEASQAGLLGFGPSTANPLTGEIVSAYTIMYPGVSKMGVSSGWDELARLYNKNQLAQPYESEGMSAGAVASNASYIGSHLATVESEDVTAVRSLARQSPAPVDVLPSEDLPEYEQVDLDAELEKENKRLQYMMENNMYPAELSSISSKIVANKTDITELDFFEDGFFTNPQADAQFRTLKSWSDLSPVQRDAVTHSFTVHQYLTTLVHEIGHNIGLRHNFSGSFDHHNFYTKNQASALNLKGISATSSIMDYTPSEINVHPAFGLYDRAALRFAYQRKVEVHPEIDENILTRSEVNYAKSTAKYELLDLASYDDQKRKDLSERSALSELIYNSDLTQSGKELKEYKFCTDGRGRATSESGCLVFDEGSSFEEITDSLIARYHRTFESRNSRKDRVEFNENDRARSKYFSLHRDFQRSNMIVDDYYRTYWRGDYKTPEQACSDVSTGSLEERCDITKAAYKQAYFYLDLLKTPEKQCLLEVDFDPALPDGTLKQRHVWSLANANYLAGLVSDSYDWRNKMPVSCFDSDMKTRIDSNPREIVSNGVSYALQYTVIGETKHGSYLNKVTFNNRASSEWASYIGYEVEHLGTWMDKLLAMGYLLEPSGLKGVDFALVDLPGVREELNNLVEHWTKNAKLPEASPIAKSFSSLHDPYAFVDSQGREIDTVAYVPNWVGTSIRSTPNSLSWRLNYWYGTNRSGSTPIAKAMLYTISKNDSSRTDLFKPEAFDLLEKTSIREVGGYVSHEPKYIDILGSEYVAGKDNSIASELITQVQNSKEFISTQYGRSEIASHLLTRDNILGQLKESSANAVTSDVSVKDYLIGSADVSALATYGQEILPWVASVNAEFDKRGSTFLSYEVIWDARETLINSKELVWNEDRGCWVLGRVGCMFGTDQRIEGGLFNTSVNSASQIAKVINEQSYTSALAYLRVYYTGLETLSPLYSATTAAIESAINEPASTSEFIDLIDSVGLRSLNIIEENEDVTQF
ncbi:zinc-dependent metalloprotease [Vibrio penaeicida]|uniref:zinc-dependent metalloprotease n=1 Tax=Vibrio penaeicida TaxID=104609 RepID=UPI000CE9E732|nr:zinc-dependent metalloprotease [Vibrio penaeicida]